MSDGGFRDAIGMLDKLISYSDKEVTLDDFEELNGIVSIEKKKEFLSMIVNSEINKIIQFIDDIYNLGKDLIIFSQDLMILCRNMIVNYYSYEKTDYDIEFLLSFVEKMDEIVISLKESNNLKIIFETKILSLVHKKNMENKQVKTVDNIDLCNKDDQNVQNDIESNNHQENTNITPTQEIENNLNTDSELEENKYNKSSNNNFIKKNKIIVNNCFYSASKDKLLYIKESWKNLNDYALDSKYGAAACYLSDATIRAAGSHEIIITFDYESMVSRGFQFSTLIEQLLFKIFDETYYVAYLTEEEWNIEKNKYIENKNNGISYQYLNLSDLNKQQESSSQNIEVKEDSTSNSIVDDAIKLFGENIVSINE